MATQALARPPGWSPARALPWVGAFAAAVFGALVLSGQPADLLVGTLLALAVLTAMVLWAASGRSRLGWILVLAFALRAGIALVNWKYDLIPERNATPLFDGHGWTIASSWKSGETAPLSELRGGLPVLSYAYIVAAIYSVFGHLPAVVPVFNCLFDVLAILAIFHLGRILFGSRAAHWAAAVEAISPYTIWISGTFLRESLTRLLLASFLLALLGWTDRRKGFSIWWVLALLPLAAAPRPENAPTLIVLVIVAWLFGWTRLLERGGQYRRYWLIALAIAAGLAFLSLGYLFEHSESLFKFSGGLDPEFFEEFRGARAHGASVYLSWIRYRTWIDILLYLPLRLFYFLYVPFPWQVATAEQAVALVDTAFQLVLSLGALFGARRLWRDRRPLALVMLVYLLLGAGSYAIVESNIGAALRHRRQFTFVLALLAAPLLMRLRWGQSKTQ